jgi:hypothetical protein
VKLVVRKKRRAVTGVTFKLEEMLKPSALASPATKRSKGALPLTIFISYAAMTFKIEANTRLTASWVFAGRLSNAGSPGFPESGKVGQSLSHPFGN